MIKEAAHDQLQSGRSRGLQLRMDRNIWIKRQAIGRLGVITEGHQSHVSRFDRSDNDAIHIFPLASVPLESKGLSRARLVKDAQLNGRVELFSDSRSGSGQIAPADLYEVFNFEQKPNPDVELVQSLSELPSYDVYSMRIHLRRLGVSLDGADELDLSEPEKARLCSYMREFLRPLVVAVYGDTNCDDMGLAELIGLFNSPDAARTRKNLDQLADDLEVDLLEIPQFIQDYGDAYLSLSYYQRYLDTVRPALAEFYQSIKKIREAPDTGALQNQASTQKRISTIGRQMRTTECEIDGVLDMFSAETNDMWQAITAEKFGRMQELIRTYQTRIGAILCAICVKMEAWVRTFPHEDAGGVAKRSEFILSRVGPGLDDLPRITRTSLSAVSR